MSINSEIERITAKVEESYGVCESKGASLPAAQIIDKLPDTIRGIASTGIDLYTTVVVEELNSATNPTGVQVQTGTYYYYKIVDDLYDSSFFVGKSLQKYATNTVIKIQSDGIMYVGNNGSYTISTTQNVVSGGGPDIIVCIQPQDVGIALTTNRGTLTFPESGTYIITGGTTTSYKVKGVGGSFKKTEATVSDGLPIWQGGMF